MTNWTTMALIEHVREGLRAYWDSPSEYESALNILADRLIEALDKACNLDSGGRPSQGADDGLLSGQ